VGRTEHKQLLRKLAASRRALPIDGERSLDTPGKIEEFIACHPVNGAAGFERFLGHCDVTDKETGTTHRMTPWPGQQRIIRHLVNWEWLIALKGRQVGFTTLFSLYTYWRMRWAVDFKGMCLAQELEYASDFKDRLLIAHEGLEPWLRARISINRAKRLTFEQERCYADLRVLAGKKKAGRSFTGDLAIFDEAAFIENFSDTVTAIMPALRGSRQRTQSGQILVLSTSTGPTGGFHDLWRETYGQHGELLNDQGVGPTGFRPVFIHWSERPGRDEAWYAEEKARLDRISSVAVKQEYPNTIEEAWEHAAGRVYPFFTTQTHVGRIEIPDTVLRYRAIDWGETKSAYVVLWIAFIPGPPGFLVSPDCPNTIREFLSYRLDEDPPYRPLKAHDHTCDAVRYAVTTFDLKGLVYVYREVYREDSIAKGWNIMSEIEEIHRLSGWERAEAGARRMFRPTVKAELFEQTVADRSFKKAIATLTQYELPTIPAKKPKGPKKRDTGTQYDDPHSEILEGIRQVSVLIDGTRDLEQRIEITREAFYRGVIEEERKTRRASADAATRRMRELAREYLNRERRRT
jgi:hypothetical protein